MIDEKDIPEDLKGDLIPEIDPEKLFDEKEYATIIIGSEGMSKKDTHNADYVTLLVSKNSTREEKDEALKHLKENNAHAFILNAITKTKKPEQKALLIAACWETGMDFSKDYAFFIDLIGQEDFSVSFEAFTVIQEMEAEIDSDTLKKSLDTLMHIKNANVNVTGAIEFIEQKLNATD
ncbi:MAG: hypothetical protein V4506_15165 [Bacteroidota bacterium]